MMVLQTSPLPLGYHSKKNVCILYQKWIEVSIASESCYFFIAVNSYCLRLQFYKYKTAHFSNLDLIS